MAGKKPAAAQAAVADASAALEAVQGAVEEDIDAKEFAELLEDLQNKVTAAETEIKQWKAETTKHGEAIAPMNSTLASLSLEMKDIKEQLKELSNKLMTATQSKPSPPETPSTEKVTPALAVVEPNSLSPQAAPPVVDPAQVEPAKENTPAAPRKRFRLV